VWLFDQLDKPVSQRCRQTPDVFPLAKLADFKFV
jgi:hypothetical protein